MDAPEEGRSTGTSIVDRRLFFARLLLPSFDSCFDAAEVFAKLFSANPQKRRDPCERIDDKE